MAKFYQIINENTGKVLAKRAKRTNNAWQRAKGLIGRQGLAEDEALIIQPAGSIHTFFMHFKLDLIFLDRRGMVIKIAEEVPPNRLILAPFLTNVVLELPSGEIKKKNTQKGHKINLETVQSG